MAQRRMLRLREAPVSNLECRRDPQAGLREQTHAWIWTLCMTWALLRNSEVMMWLMLMSELMSGVQ